MLTSLALVFLVGLILGSIAQKLKLPALIGMLLTGILLGPYALNVLDGSILDISADLRKLALVIILTRAGLGLNIKELKKVGRPAILMCFMPALFEIIGVVILAPPLIGVSVVEAALIGSVVAAVSPAVVVPRMLKLIEKGYGKEHSIPQLIMAGSSVDDVFVIVLFASFMDLAKGEGFSFIRLTNIPISIILGVVVGILLGLGLIWLFKHLHLRDSMKVLILLSIAFLLVALEDWADGKLSGLLAVMCVGITLLQGYPVVANRLSLKFSKLWVGAELILFVLVGATVDMSYALGAGAMAILLILGALMFRMLGVYLCLIKTPLTAKERLFCGIAYLPKATVQAAIGGIPLANGLTSGKLVLTVAVLAILITAPLGALGVDRTYKKLLPHSSDKM